MGDGVAVASEINFAFLGDGFFSVREPDLGLVGGWLGVWHYIEVW